MRVLHLYSGNLYGGIERVLVTLAGVPDTPDFEQRFVLFFEGRLARELRGAGAHVELVGPARIGRPWQVLRARRALRRSLERWGPDVVLAHSPWALGIAGSAIRRDGMTRALWLHNPPTRRWWPDLFALGRRRAPDRVLANSRFTAEAARPLIPVDGWLHYPVPAPEAIAPETRGETRRQLGASPDDVVILQACRIERWKGLHVQLEALARLREVPGWMLWIAGGPQRSVERAYFDELRAQAKRSGIVARVRFLGQREDVSTLMAAADVYSQPNLEPEPFGVSLVEAMWAGLPVITMESGGLADEIAGVSGLVVPAGDAGALASALRQLIQSPDRRRAFGCGGSALAARLCDPSRQVRRLRKALAPSGAGLEATC